MTEPAPTPPSDRSAKRRAGLRVVLGTAQMFFAVATIVAGSVTGLTTATATLAIITAALTLTSVCLYHDFLGFGRN